jgi:hypothetical protein
MRKVWLTGCLLGLWASGCTSEAREAEGAAAPPALAAAAPALAQAPAPAATGSAAAGAAAGATGGAGDCRLNVVPRAPHQKAGKGTVKLTGFGGDPLGGELKGAKAACGALYAQDVSMGSLKAKAGDGWIVEVCTPGGGLLQVTDEFRKVRQGPLLFGGEKGSKPLLNLPGGASYAIAKKVPAAVKGGGHQVDVSAEGMRARGRLVLAPVSELFADVPGKGVVVEFDVDCSGT